MIIAGKGRDKSNMVVGSLLHSDANVRHYLILDIFQQSRIPKL